MLRDPSTAVLRTIPLLAELDDWELASISRIVRKRTYPKGSILFLEGDPGDAFYLILTGEVKVFIQGADGREFILAFLWAGDFFGEMSLFDGRPRSASVRATEDSTLFILHKREFFDQVKGSCPLLVKFLIALCQRLRDSNERLADLALLDTYKRIAKALLLHGKSGGVPADVGELIVVKRPTHQDLANMVGASRETVTRVVNTLAKQGHISLHGHEVTIRKAFLEHLSDV